MMAQENQVWTPVRACAETSRMHSLLAPSLGTLFCACDTRAQVIKDTDAADARYCGGAMTGGTGWMCW